MVGKKNKAPEPEKKKVKSFSHREKRVNIPTKESEGILSDDKSAPKRVQYPREEVTKPRLIWKGKQADDAHPLEVDAVPIYVQEKIHPQAIVTDLERYAKEGRASDAGCVGDLFGDFNGLTDPKKRLEFYQHKLRWTNRMILGDSLQVMASLAEKEDMRGKVQCIYIDPPYGIEYKSNWQPKMKSATARDNDETREPEMVRAYRDTWRHGVNSYLSYLRDRLTVAKDLLTETGSCFVQIGDENVHLVGALMDEIFQSNNRVATISFATTSGSSTNRLPQVADYLLWYAKDKDVVKYRQLYEKMTRAEIVRLFNRDVMVELPNGSHRKPTPEERFDPDRNLPKGSRIYGRAGLDAQGVGRSEPYQYNGRTFNCGEKRHWAISHEGMDTLAKMGRLEALDRQNSLRWIKYEDEVPGRRINNLWSSQMYPQDRGYVVETATSVIQRCILMTTDPGDLVLDPTCGGGTTAYTAEQWGRRWITCDTSRVALAIARARMMGAQFDYYLLQDSKEGAEKSGKPTDNCTDDLRQGFVYKSVPKVSPGVLAYGEDADPILLYDQPEKSNRIVRVTGAFTMESLSPHRVLPLDAAEDLDSQSEPESGDKTRFWDAIAENLKVSGVQTNDKKTHLVFSSVESCASGRHIQFDARYQENGKEKRAAICIGPQHGTVTSALIANAARETGKFYDLLVVLGFAFESYTDGINTGRLPVIRSRMNTDLLMADRLKEGGGNLFVSFGEPDIQLRKVGDDKFQVEILGIDIYDPTTNRHKTSDAKDIACWFVDTDYNEESFFVRHAYFSDGGKDPYAKLKTTLQAEIDEEAWKSMYGTISRPFPKPKSGLVAVKAVNDFGDEVMKILSIDKAE